MNGAQIFRHFAPTIFLPFESSHNLQWPRGANFHIIVNFLWKFEYTCKKAGLCVMSLFFYLWWPKVTRGQKLKTSQRDRSFCMYTQISIRNYIMHESLFLKVIEGHENLQKFLKNQSIILFLNNTLPITPREIISGMYISHQYNFMHTWYRLCSCYN